MAKLLPQSCSLQLCIIAWAMYGRELALLWFDHEQYQLYYLQQLSSLLFAKHKAKSLYTIQTKMSLW